MQVHEVFHRGLAVLALLGCLGGAAWTGWVVWGAASTGAVRGGMASFICAPTMIFSSIRL
ncbi:MAG: hypothetical protein P0Y50_07145 [Candidatus Brevundimonas colombiensis]|uniref:Uncharacterized protein n=1 Tax=Candidatus Brevundimonas colombiensis TaxID=3121376 RepID=A0AAJ6BKY7_9CAUL|nr:hypothetical protein [Brevundimonas sp.]WEK41375.1 MAG: hypothetical protein P0Y50_07145 [Brevundimonas sp.]